MFIADESRKEVDGLSNLIDYCSVVADGIVSTTTDLLFAGWEFQGPDMDALPLADCWGLANRIARHLNLGPGWTVQCDLIREEYTEYCPEAAPGDWMGSAIAYLIDHERRIRFSETGNAAPRLSRYYLTLSYQTIRRHSEAAAGWLIGTDKDREDHLGIFEKQVAEIDTLLTANLLSVRRLRCRTDEETGQIYDELMQHCRHCITGEDYPFALADVPVHLNQYCATDSFTGGSAPMLGDPEDKLMPGKRIVVLAIDSFPARSFAGILRALDQVPYSFRFSQTAQIMDTQQAKKKHEKHRGKWKSKKTTMAAKVSQAHAASDSVDTVAAGLEAEATDAMSMAEHGLEINADWAGKIVLMDSSYSVLLGALKSISHTLHQSGFSFRHETVNAVAAWLGSFPAHHYKDPRQMLVTTHNLVHMMPLSAPFRGRRYNASQYFPPRTPPLFYGMTSGGTPFRYHAQTGRASKKDCGHTVVVGPNGSGKTTFFTLVAVQWLRFADSQVVVFDKKRMFYTLTKAIGGDYHDLSPDTHERQFCPLADLETPGAREWAVQYLELLCELNHLTITAEITNDLKTAVMAISLMDDSPRSLTAFRMAVRNQEIQRALEFYLDGMLDGDTDNLAFSRFSVFEMDELYRLNTKTMNAVLFYIFGRIRRRLHSGIPTLVLVDEFREALEHPLAAKQFDDWLYEGRKLNMAVFLALQDTSKVLHSPLKSAVLQQCFTVVALPQPLANTPEAIPDYEALGFNQLDRELIAGAEPKSHYYVATPEGKRMISLQVGQLALAFFGASSDTDRPMVDQLIARHGKRWPGVWLRQRGLSAWADIYDDMTGAAKEAAAYA